MTYLNIRMTNSFTNPFMPMMGMLNFNRMMTNPWGNCSLFSPMGLGGFFGSGLGFGAGFGSLFGLNSGYGGCFGMGTGIQPYPGVNPFEISAKIDMIIDNAYASTNQNNVYSLVSRIPSLEEKLDDLEESEDVSDENKSKIKLYRQALTKMQDRIDALDEDNCTNNRQIYSEIKEMTKSLDKIAKNISKLEQSVTSASKKKSKKSSAKENKNTQPAVNVQSTSGSGAGKKLSLNSAAYGPKFLNKVKEISKRLNCDYRDLLGVMNAESGINAAAKNPNSSATGLIQFMEATARDLGTSTAALRTMSPIKQLDYVEKYLARAKAGAGMGSKRLSPGELYALVFLPGRANREVLTTSGEKYYNANRGLDTNKDGKITKSELDAKVRSHYVSDSSFTG